ncbi:hypothetical protein pb186bvf_001818 [Paramecium bursaria]
MDTEKIQRNKGDLNLNLKYQNELIVDDKSDKYNSFNTINDPKTKSLTLLSINQDQIDLYDVIPYYNEIKSIIFDTEFDRDFIYSEMREFNNIEEMKNQRILIEKNNQSSVLSVMDNESQQLMVIKRIETFSLENSIQKFDEYKIHYNINQKYPQTSLKLFTPVKIQKQSQYFTIQALMERAQFNLYDYSRKYQITKEHAYYILIQILQQIINMHSINIAHRDVKPQNIFYVKDKGWLLSDFGESQEYQEVDSLYNVRGTIRNRIVKQNLLINDIYALVVSIIIIQKQQYITDIQEIIQLENDQVLKDLLQINQLDTLEKYFEDLKFLIEKKFHINYENPIYKQLNAHQITENNKYLYLSWISLYRNYYKNNIHPQFTNQLLRLIQGKFIPQQIMQLEEKIIYSLYELVFDGINIMLEQPLHLLKHFNKYNLNQQKILVKLLFQFGFNEKTIYYANQILKYNYCQEIHLLIIFCYQRNFMYENCRNELLLFNQQLQLDQLNSFYLYEYLDIMKTDKYIDSEYSRLNSQNFIKTAKGIIQYPHCVVELFNSNQQNENIVNNYINYLITYCGGNYIFVKERFASEVILIAMQQMPLDIYRQFVRELNNIYMVVIDQNKKVVLLSEFEKHSLQSGQLLTSNQNFTANFSYQNHIEKRIKKKIQSLHQKNQTISKKIQSNWCIYISNVQLIKLIQPYLDFEFLINLKLQS